MTEPKKNVQDGWARWKIGILEAKIAALTGALGWVQVGNSANYSGIAAGSTATINSGTWTLSFAEGNHGVTLDGSGQPQYAPGFYLTQVNFQAVLTSTTDTHVIKVSEVVAGVIDLPIINDHPTLSGSWNVLGHSYNTDPETSMGLTLKYEVGLSTTVTFGQIAVFVMRLGDIPV